MSNKITKLGKGIGQFLGDVRTKKTPKKAPVGGGGRRYTGGSGRPTDDERRAVKAMQEVMRDLSKGMTAQAEELSKGALKGQTPDQIKKAARLVTDTGQNTQTAVDGKWGNRTMNALKQINSSIVDNLAVKGPEKVIVGRNYLQRKSTEVQADADSNITKIVAIMKALKLNSQYFPKGTVPVNLDYVPRTFSGWTSGRGGAEDPIAFPPTQANGLPVTTDTLKNVSSLFDLISHVMGKSGVDKKASVSDIAKMIVEGNIVRLGKTEPRNLVADAKRGTRRGARKGGKKSGVEDLTQPEDPWKRDKKPKEEKPKIPRGAITPEQFERALNWLWNRSGLVYAYLQQAMRGEENNPATDKPVTESDVNKAKFYYRRIRELYNQYQSRYKRYFENQGYVDSAGFKYADLGYTGRGDRGRGTGGGGAGGRIGVDDRGGRGTGGGRRGRRSRGGGGPGTGYVFGTGSGEDDKQLLFQRPPLISRLNFDVIARAYDMGSEVGPVADAIDGIGVQNDTFYLRTFNRTTDWRKIYAEHWGDLESLKGPEEQRGKKSQSQKAKEVIQLCRYIIAGVGRVMTGLNRQYSGSLYDERVGRMLENQAAMKDRWVRAANRVKYFTEQERPRFQDTILESPRRRRTRGRYRTRR